MKHVHWLNVADAQNIGGAASADYWLRVNKTTITLKALGKELMNIWQINTVGYAAACS